MINTFLQIFILGFFCKLFLGAFSFYGPLVVSCSMSILYPLFVLYHSFYCYVCYYYYLVLGVIRINFHEVYGK